jgi:hypothetical protein
MKMKIRRMEGLISKVEELESELSRFKAAGQNQKTKEKSSAY